MNVDTLIVGGGISGLYLNYLIKNKNKNKNTCLIEKSSYFGGRVETFTTKFRIKNIQWKLVLVDLQIIIND